MLTCQQSSKQVEESLWGTAPSQIHHWLLVEVPQAWPAKIDLDSLELSSIQRSSLQEKSKTEGWKLLWIRQQKSEQEPRIFYCDLHLNTIVSQTLKSDWSLECVEHWNVHPEPMILVCTHGARDRCCGILGGKVFASLSEIQPQWLWQSSHLGGHRFAPTLLVLPKGEMLGRVDDIPSADLMEWVQGKGGVSVNCLRGNVRLDSREQALDAWVAAQNGREWMDCDSAGIFTWRNQQGTLLQHQILREELGDVLASCGDEHLKTVSRWNFVQVT